MLPPWCLPDAPSSRIGKLEGAMDQQAGILAALPVATPGGWRRAGALRPGDPVWVVDGPPQPVVHLQRFPVPKGWAVRLPPGAIGNPDAVLLLPQQSVALDLDQAAQIYGDPLALIPAAALVGWRGIARWRVAPDVAVQIGFAKRQLIYAGPGVLLCCEGSASPLLHPDGPPAPPLTGEQARHLMACVMAEEIGAELRIPPRQAALAGENRP